MYINYGDKDFFEYSVDITDNWIDKQAVMGLLGMDSESFNPAEYALGCIDFYGMENFGANSYAYDYMRMIREDIKDILKYRLITSDNLDIVW